ncbi:MAG TPA: hypothetical protein IAB04_02910 [Candidatus Avimonoglobus intestinipullorum]|uniref:Terminase small subunit n=1 Tax=Candidatus Avimonoglobus intestinipullorum TaxID=2840699 RepID=A0A9D1S5S0_9FIRM|nr:hypothetical protein [Candidatus Avimonoglobus intestinipullorum]
MIDWAAIKTEYINTGVCYRELAEKNGISRAAVAKHAAAEKWRELRSAPQEKTQSLAQLAEKLIETTGRAIDQLEGNVDTQKLKQLVSSVKELKEIMKALPDSNDNGQADHEALIQAIREAGNAD